MTSTIFDDTPCELGEGPLWHPRRQELFWFDILGKRLHRKGDGPRSSLQFDEHVSAAGWLDEGSLLVASETALLRVDIASGARDRVAPLEADDPVTRSNDGRADPWGGFWIGTMGKKLEPGLGSIYRYYRGEVRRLYGHITVSNAICFSPDRRFAYFTDTPTQKIMRQPLSETDGWPKGDAEVWLDLTRTRWRPDGAVVDAEGNFWNAQWGGHRVACYDAAGTFLREVRFEAVQTSCPAFGGADLRTLFCTSAREGMSDEVIAKAPAQGMTFAAADIATGQEEHRVIL